MFTFQADLLIDLWDKRQREQAEFLARALPYPLVPNDEGKDVVYYREELEPIIPSVNKPTISQGISFSVQFAFPNMPTKEFLDQFVRTEILAPFMDCPEIMYEVYSMEPEPPHLNNTIIHERKRKQNKAQRERTDKYFEQRKEKARRDFEKGVKELFG